MRETITPDFIPFPKNTISMLITENKMLPLHTATCNILDEANEGNEDISALIISNMKPPKLNEDDPDDQILIKSLHFIGEDDFSFSEFKKICKPHNLIIAPMSILQDKLTNEEDYERDMINLIEWAESYSKTIVILHPRVNDNIGYVMYKHFEFIVSTNSAYLNNALIVKDDSNVEDIYYKFSPLSRYFHSTAF